MTGIPLNFYNFLDLPPMLTVIPCDEAAHFIPTHLRALPLVQRGGVLLLLSRPATGWVKGLLPALVALSNSVTRKTKLPSYKLAFPLVLLCSPCLFSSSAYCGRNVGVLTAIDMGFQRPGQDGKTQKTHASSYKECPVRPEQARLERGHQNGDLTGRFGAGAFVSLEGRTT